MSQPHVLRSTAAEMEDALQREALQVLGISSLPAPVEWLFRRIVAIRGLGRLHEKIHRLPPELGFYDRMVQAQELRITVEPGMEAIPATGPLLLVANHPFGMLEGIILGYLLSKRRQDWKIMTTSLVAAFPELRNQYVIVDPFSTAESARLNRQGLRESLEHLRAGGLLVIFPAGAVAHWQWSQKRVAEAPWAPNIMRLIRRAQAPVLPLFFAGRNSVLFYSLGVLHPLIRTAMLARQMLNKQGHSLLVRVGLPIPPQEIATYATDEELASALQASVLQLAQPTP